MSMCPKCGYPGLPELDIALASAQRLKVERDTLREAIKAHLNDPLCDAWTTEHLKDILMSRKVSL